MRIRHLIVAVKLVRWLRSILRSPIECVISEMIRLIMSKTAKGIEDLSAKFHIPLSELSKDT